MKTKSVFLKILLLTILSSGCQSLKYPPPPGEFCQLLGYEDNPEEAEECHCINTALPGNHQEYSKPPHYCFDRVSVTVRYKEKLYNWASENRTERIKCENEGD